MPFPFPGTNSYLDLRDSLGHELVDRLSAWAQAIAHAFRAQGKLFAFGNGGSSTDAQALA
jgi:D-sedoheptulose 7-phosphate isomerase